MSEIHLNDRTLRTLSTDKLREDFKDLTFVSGEFGVRVSSNGSKRFFIRYRVNGKRRRMVLGSYPSLSLVEARKRALKHMAQIDDGADPAKARQQLHRADTVAALYAAFMKQKAASFARTTYRNYWAMWAKDCEKLIGDMKASEVQRCHIVAILDSIEARTSGAPHMANRTRSMLTSLFSWGLAKGRCQHNPVIGVPKAQKRELPGERFLSCDELRLYWQHTAAIDATDRAFWRLLLLLALRPGEVMKLRWDWIDGEVLTLPASQVKNKKEHRLYLTAMTRAEIESLRTFTGQSEFLFPGNTEGSSRKDFGDAHDRLALVMNIPYWTPRDIRRTCETQMRTFIRDSEGISRVLNHDVSAIRKHYDKGDYFARKREVLTAWSNWLKALVEQKENKVVNLFD